MSFNTTSFDDDQTEEWAWTFQVPGGNSVCLTGDSNDTLPWQKTVSAPISFSSSDTQIRMTVIAWEKDAPGSLCVWEHNDVANQRIQGSVVINLNNIAYGQQATWTQTLVFLYRPWDLSCSTTVSGQILKKDTNYMVKPSCFLASPQARVHEITGPPPYPACGPIAGRRTAGQRSLRHHWQQPTDAHHQRQGFESRPAGAARRAGHRCTHRVHRQHLSGLWYTRSTSHGTSIESEPVACTRTPIRPSSSPDTSLFCHEPQPRRSRVPW